MQDNTDPPLVSVRDLSFAYPSGPPVLQNVTFQIAPGECVGLIGPSGAGKSTLLWHLNGLLPETLVNAAQHIPVTIAGTPLEKRTAGDIRRQVGLVFQDPDDQLFCPTVREDVAFGPQNLGLSPEAARQRTLEALQSVGLEDLAARSTLQLSFGERKRVCLAGVLACEPSVLLLDEPSANLDPRARRQLLGILQDFSGALLLASHDLDLVAQLCQRVMVLDEGLIRSDAATDQVLTDAVLMERHGLEVPLRLRCRCDDEPAD